MVVEFYDRETVIIWYRIMKKTKTKIKINKQIERNSQGLHDYIKIKRPNGVATLLILSFVLCFDSLRKNKEVQFKT